MIYNETAKCYQPYLSGSSTPKMVSTWSAAEGYKWTGEYYFKTNIETDSHISHRLTDGTSFVIKVSILGENNPKSISATMTISARYRDGFTITPETDAQDYAVRTMLQKQYQAIGTRAVYDIAMPTDCVPNYANFTVNGISTTTTTIQSTYATVTINSVAQTVTVVLNADAKAIDKVIEIRIPYRRPGDYVNPYLSVQITPVYFEFDDLEVIGHYESTIHLSSDNDKTQLNYRALFNYNTNMASESLNNKMKTFNNSLKNSNLLKFNYETPGEITVQIPYTYVNGVPVISQNGDGRYIHTFYYDVQQAVLERTEYLAVGTTATYTFYNWDALAVSAGLYLQNSNTAVDSFWSKDLKIQKNNTVLITVSLENKSSETDINAYDALVRNGKITINLYSALNSNAAQLSLNIIPVYFTFDEFKLQNNPVRPLVALTTPTTVTVAASGISASNYIAEKTHKIDVFNNELLNAQNDTSSNAALSFSRIPNDDGILNFNFDPETRNITRADKDEPVTAISYLLVTACIIYEDGVPKLSNSGNKISTYIPVQTFGENTNGNGSEIPGLELAPNGRTRTVAQAIDTRIRYDVSLPNIIYDSRLDKSEISSSGTEEWTSNMGWDALISVKENKITVVLEDSAELFDRILSIKAYSQEGELVYILNIIPARFTVEQIILADHIDESPVMIRANDDNWLQNLNLDFVDVHGVSNFDYATAINNFRTSLNEGLVSRIDDSGYITLLAGVNYVNGLPVLDNLVNGAITVKNVYRYEIVDGIPENTKAQAVGTEVVYNVNRDNFSIKVFNQDNESWEISNFNSIYSVDYCGSNQPRCIKVNLASSINLIGKRIRIGIFDMNNNGSEPEYILNIIPSYFTVDDLTAKGQNREDRNLIFYYGENPSSPRNVVFDAIIGAYSSDYAFVSNNQIDDKINEFITDLQGDKASLITRIFDSSAFSGDFHVTAYLKYIEGVPTLVQSDDGLGFVTRLDIDFVFAIYQRNDLDGNVLPLPTGPRTRSEVQAIGTKTSYTIDLGKSLSVDTSLFDDTDASNRGWKANFVDNVLTVDLQPAIGSTPEETKDGVTQ